ncbi:MAG TPA: DHA2 family efflux MFS transporter permease subunit [Candidatus Dormibacteraeota bacterium]
MITRLRSNPWVTLLVLCLGLFMILLDTTIVYVATPSMLSALHASLDEVLWVFNGYLITYAVLLIPAGRLGDLFGPKRMFMAGLAVFTAASAVCGLSHDANQLIAARVIQGAGGAMLSPQTLPFVTSLFAPERRGAAFGMFGAVIGLATVAGPTLGGLIVTYSDWRWIFFLNVPVGVLALVATAGLVPDLRAGRLHSLDPVGVLLATAGLFAIVFGLIEGQRYDWGTIAGSAITIPMVLLAGGALVVLFVVWEARQREPLVPLRLFRYADYSVSNWINVALAFGMQAAFIPLTIYTQSVLGMSALSSGLTFAPMSLAAAVVAMPAGRLADRVGSRRLLTAGLILFGGGMLWVSQLAALNSTIGTFLVPMLAAGTGMGFTFAPLTAVAMRAIAPADAGAASGVFNTTRQVGSALGAAAVGAVLQNRLAAYLPEQAAAASGQLPAPFRAGFVEGFRNAAKAGFEVGTGQSGGISLPAGLPASVAAQLHTLVVQVFDNGYLLALRPTVAVGVAVLLAGAASALLLERRWKRAPEVVPAEREAA